jgi:peptide deformylase
MNAMSILPIFLYGTDVLRQKARPIASLNDGVIKLAYDMMETMHKASGIGLAANQVGSLDRIIVVDITGVEEEREDGEAPDPEKKNPDRPTRLVMLNPEVMQQSGQWVVEEGCLSIPDVRADVERAERVLVRFRDINFRPRELEADGLLARVILHEIDHLDGILFIDHLTTAGRSLLKPKLRRIRKGDTEAAYPVVPAGAAKKSGRVEA